MLARPRPAIKCYQKAGLHDRAAKLLLVDRRPLEASNEFKISLGKLGADPAEQAERAGEYVDLMAVCVPGGLAQAVEMAITYMTRENKGYVKALELLTGAEMEGKYGGKAELARSKSTAASVATLAAKALLRGGQRDECVELLAKLPNVNQGIDWLQTTKQDPNVLADLLHKLGRPGEEAAVRIKLGDLTEAAELLKQAGRSAAADGDGGSARRETNENLRARCLLASAAQQYLVPDDEGVVLQGKESSEIRTLLEASKTMFQKLGDEKGEARSIQETLVVEGIVAANEAVATNRSKGGGSDLAKPLTATLRRLGMERDGWGVALLVQATPPAARALLGHEGWQSAITAVAETAEALLRAGGAQSNTRAAQVTHNPKP
jgi:tetratricopeptide (TPR) repeat protein